MRRLIPMSTALALACGLGAQGDKGDVDTVDTTGETQVDVPDPKETDTVDPVESDTPDPTPEEPRTVRAIDLADDAGFQDFNFGHWKRGRACSIQDFDLDDRLDFYVGNPGNESHIMRNILTAGQMTFINGVTLSDSGFLWSVSSADYDNDGDVDLFVAGGGNESVSRNWMLVNRIVETGVFNLLDRSEQTGTKGAQDEEGFREQGHGGGNWVDLDNDGLLDLFVAVNSFPLRSTGTRPDDGVDMYNLLFHNVGNGDFEEIAQASGLTSRKASRHAAWLDYDLDGDLDLYESACGGPNGLYKNMFVETGAIQFTDVTAEASLHGDLGQLYQSFGAAVGDVNQDGYEDLIVVKRDVHCTWDGAPEPDVELQGHQVYLNVEGRGFANVTEHTQINARFPTESGVMGFQVSDMDNDGFPDVYIGNGGPGEGQADNLFLSVDLVDVDLGGEVGVVKVQPWKDRTALIDFPAEPITGREYPPYPYRTHGVCTGDMSGNGRPEIAVSNGGMWSSPNVVAEPNRLFELVREPTPHFLQVWLRGDGDAVSNDGIGARARLTVSVGDDGPQRQIYLTRRGNNGFSADNGPLLQFGLDQADTIHELQITWPDGTVQTLTDRLPLDSRMDVHYPSLP